MSLTLYLIKDHYMAVHNCDDNKEIKFQFNGETPRGKMLFLSSCSVVAEYYLNKKVNLRCEDCGESYTLSREQFKIARNRYNKFTII